LFVEYYKEELDNINARHVAIAHDVRQRIGPCLTANPPSRRQPAPDRDDSKTLRNNLRDLADQLYTFVACGVHSSVKTDADSSKILTRLGFTLDRSFSPIHMMGLLAGLSLIAVMILSIFTVYSAQLFRDSVLGPLFVASGLDQKQYLIEVLRFPPDLIGLFLWSWTTAFFYFAAILGSLWVRNSRIAKREWFNINNLERARPIPRYVTPTLVGTVLGCVALFIIAFLGGPGFKSPFSDSVVEAMQESLPWFALAMLVALIAVVLCDSDLGEDRHRWRRIIVRSVCGGAAMALVAYLDGGMIISSRIPLGAPAAVTQAGNYLSIFLAAQIGLFAS